MRFIIGTLLLIALVTCGVVAQDVAPSAWKEFTSKEGQFTVSFPETPTTFKLTKSLPGKIATQDPPPPVKVEDVTTTVAKVFKSTEGRFTVVFPGDPKVEEETVDTALGPVKIHHAIFSRGSTAYYVSYTDLPVGPETPSQTKEMLNGSRDELLASGFRLMTDTDVTVAGIGGREWLTEKDGVITRVRAFYLKQRLYQLIFHARVDLAFRNGKPSPNPADRTEIFEKTSLGFFDSFKLIN